MLALSPLLGKIGSKSRIPVADELRGVENGIAQVSRAPFLHVGIAICIMAQIQFDHKDGNVYPNFILNDCIIGGTEVLADGVCFYFPKGVYIRNMGDVPLTHTGSAAICFCGIDPANIQCTLLYRFPALKKVRKVGRNVEFTEIAKILNSAKQIEIVDVLQGYQHIYWRGECYAYKRLGITIELQINLCEWDTIECYWNDDLSY